MSTTAKTHTLIFFFIYEHCTVHLISISIWYGVAFMGPVMTLARFQRHQVVMLDGRCGLFSDGVVVLRGMRVMVCS